jgi:hypothetical protein
MHLLLLPGMDGTGQLFDPLLGALPPSLPASSQSQVSDLDTDKPLTHR